MKLIFSIFIIFIATPAFSQNLYVYSKNGVPTFSSKRPANKRFSNFKSKRRVKYSYYRTSRTKFRARKSQYDKLISELSSQYGVEPAFVKAVMHAESAFKVKAKSHKGATGLMQLMPATARRFGVKNIWSPVDNIQGGVKYLSWLNREFNGNLKLVAAGYNAGEGAVKKYRGIPPYKETKGYVSKVISLRNQYKCDLSGISACGV